MISAFRSAATTTARALWLVRMVLMFLVLGGLVMYPVELFLIGHWLPNFEAQIPFFLTVPAVLVTIWYFFDYKTSWMRIAYIVVMWLAILTGVLGAYYHWVYNMEDARGVEWTFSYSMAQFHGLRPVLAALAYTNMGVTGLACIYRAR